MNTQLFREVSTRCGLAAMIAPGVLKRVLQQHKLTVEYATESDYLVVLPELHRRLSIYLTADETDHRIALLEQWLLSLVRGSTDLAR